MKKIATVLLLLITFFSLQNTADAASVIEKNGNVFGQPKSFQGKIRVDISGGSVKYVRHAKYLDKSMKTAVQVAQVKGNKITGFAYNCPGYYLTRVYSDSAGTNMIGYIRVQVVASDVTTKGCQKVSEATATPPPSNTINQTHPVPEIEEKNNMVGDTGGGDGGGTKPEPSPEPEDPYKEPQYLTAKEKCDLNNNNGATMWEIRWKPLGTPTENGHVSGPYCVDMSECMYNSDLWQCSAPTNPPNTGTGPDDDATGVPPRDQYSELIDEEDFGSCGIGDTIKNNAVTESCETSEEGGSTSRSGKPRWQRMWNL